MTSEELTTLVRDLANWYVLKERAKAQRAALLEALTANPEYQLQSLALDQAAKEIEHLETCLRAAAIEAYAATGEKKLHSALGIRLVKRVSYDEETARGYCLEKLPSLLTLDKKRFEKVALELPLDFVQVTQEPQGTIAQDLSAYIQEG